MSRCWRRRGRHGRCQPRSTALFRNLSMSVIACSSDSGARTLPRLRRKERQPCADAESSARGAKWGVSIEPCVITEALGKPAGVAVAARSHIGMAMPSAVALAADRGCSGPCHGRFRLRHIGAICRGGFFLGSIYLHDSVGASAQCNLDLLQMVAAQLCTLKGPWLVGGDWNCAPADLVATGWLELVGGAVFAPSEPTCNGKVYDYFVVSRNFAHAVHSVRTVPDGLFEPNRAVLLFLRAAPRCITRAYPNLT